MSKLALKIDHFTESLVKLNLVPTVEATWLEGYKSISGHKYQYPEDLDVYKNCVVLCFYDKLVGGEKNDNYNNQVNNFKEFLDNKEVKYDVSEKFNKNLGCKTTRFKIAKKQLDITIGPKNY